MAVKYYWELGDPVRAEPLARQALDGFRRIHGPDAPSVIETTFHLAMINPDDKETERMIADGYRHSLRVLGPVAIPTALFRVSTIWHLNNRGDYPAAEREAVEAVALYRQKIGESHGVTHQAAWVLCEVYANTGRYDDLARVAREWRDIGLRVFGDQQEHTLRFTQYLAKAHAGRGQYAEAIRLLEQVYRIQARNLGPSNPWAIEAARLLVPSYIRHGRTANALPLVERIVAVERERGAGTPNLAGVLAQFSTDLLAAGQFSAVEPYLRECLAIREKVQPDAWNTFNTRSQLGGALLGQKNYPDAEPLLIKGYEGMKAREKAIPPQASTRIPEAIDRLIALYTATNKPDDVTKWRAERAKYPPEAAPPPRETK